MSLKGLILITIIIILSSLVVKIKATKLRVHERKYGNFPKYNILNYHTLQTRHRNHLLHKKLYKCDLFENPNAQLKKQSRYPTLDKIANRLDNLIDRGSTKIKTSTTLNPFDRWKAIAPSSKGFGDNKSKYVYVTVGLKNEKTTTAALTNKKPAEQINHGEEWLKGNTDIELGVFDSNNDITVNSYNKEFMQDFTTLHPWDGEQHDVFSQGAKNFEKFEGIVESTSSFPLFQRPLAMEEKTFKKIAKDKVSFTWPLGKSVSRPSDIDDKRKKPISTPYVAAHNHYEQVLRIGDCHVPKEKVIKVHEVHPDPSKSYSPSCTVLHQCGDDTGCCRDLKQVCKPKNTTKVELYFFTTTLGKPQTVEKLYFDNHTECECQRRTDESMPRDSEFRKTQTKKLYGTYVMEGQKKILNCTCPSRYSPRYYENGTCACDCFDKQDDCLTLKRGKTHFSYNDKVCIQQELCLQPSCEFGSYIKQFGRCPNRRENYNWSATSSFRDLIT